MKYLLLFVVSSILSTAVMGQNIVKGVVKDSLENPVYSASVGIVGTSIGTSTNLNGKFQFNYNGQFPLIVRISHINFINKEVIINAENDSVKVLLEYKTQLLDEIDVKSTSDRRTVSMMNIDAISLMSNPAPAGDISGILKTLPGVVSNNELSNSYSVRGGNYDENIVLVEGIPVYRPFLITNGQQEGLSFINQDMTESLSFSSGGWEPMYGGKLSSVLSVKYKREIGLKAKAEAGLLGGRLYLAGGNKKFSYSLGSRRKSVGYLLNTFDTEGQYLPRFTDFQGLFTANPNPKTEFKLLTYYGRNRYYIQPQSRTTEFGTFSRSFRLFVGFEGSEVMNFDTYQGAIKFSRQMSDSWKLNLITSRVNTNEREYRNVEGGYRLCDLDNNPGSGSFNECITTRGIGSNFNYSRNVLNADISDIWLNSSHEVNRNNEIEWGFIYNTISVNDVVDEYSYLDSAGYTIDMEKLYSDNELSHSTYTGYAQHDVSLSDRAEMVYGVRVSRIGLTDELLFLPRLRMSYAPEFLTGTNFNLGTGYYIQTPFYRELRRIDGTLNRDIKSQKSYHIILGMKKDIVFWERVFVLSSELYYKNMWDVIAYDIDNVRVRYFANNNTIAEILGADFRFSGEFIPGTESWFSLGLLSAREDIVEDTRGFIRRPTDQSITFGAFFQDHFPGDPSMRVSLNLQFGSGLPFGPPQSVQYRNVFSGDMYRRIDIGFIKDFSMKNHRLTLSAEVLNLLGAENAITYSWIKDFNNEQIAVPNGLSSRFFNLKLLFRL